MLLLQRSPEVSDPLIEFRSQASFSQLQRSANAAVNQTAETHLLSSWERTVASHLDSARLSVGPRLQ